jgi:methylamine utilization protein MauE
MRSQVDVQLALLLALRLALAFTLLPSAVAKLFNLEQFVKDLTAYEVLPPSTARAAGLALPLLEFTLGVALFIGIMLPDVGLVAGLLFSSFALGVALNLRRGRSILCGCRGIVGSARISWGLVTRSCLLSVASFTVGGLAASTVGANLRPISLAPDWAMLSSPVAVVMLIVALACSIALLHLLGSAIDMYLRIAQLGSDLYRQQKRSIS